MFSLCWCENGVAAVGLNRLNDIRSIDIDVKIDKPTTFFLSFPTSPTDVKLVLQLWDSIG